MKFLPKLRNRQQNTVELPQVGPVKRVRPARHVTATIELPPGVGFKDLVAGTVKASIKDRLEAAAGWPPGSMLITPNMHNAQLVDAVLSDPRIILNAVPWEGPSWTNGASIADSISIGMYQDGTECEVEIPETQIQIMGQVGSGKSLGGAWNALGEMITRNDVVVWGIDIKKGLQTLGPLAPALHRVATTPEEARDLLEDANNLITPRTNYLSSEGLGKWFKGCGIKYLVVWIEEAPYVMDALGSKGEKTWVNTVKAARSAGITVAWSLQRAGFKEISTIARGQATKWCFGVQDVKEAAFGLSKVQKEYGCTPELWGQRKPGMSYIDAPNIPESKVAMPLRAWWWGRNDAVIKAHAAKYPWEDRPYDDLMTEYFEAKARGDIAVIDTKPTVPVPTVEAAQPPTTPTTPAEPALNARQRGAIGRKLFEQRLELLKGTTVVTADFVDIIDQLNLTRPWINLRFEQALKDGKVKKHVRDGAVTWEVLP